ncbi:MAG: hydroxyacid dehydrogenase [Alphaproteobacteria bacterium]
MAPAIKKLTFFEKWMDPIAEGIVAAAPGINLTRLSYDAPLEANGRAMRETHGYQIAPRTELREPWFGNADLLARCPNLLAISTSGVGYDVVDVEACTKAGVIVINQAGSNKEAVAEHTLGLMLSLAKKIAETDRLLRKRKGLDRFAYSGNDLAGKTVGIIGIGNIGTRTAELCRVFNMTVLACDPYLSAAAITARGAAKVELAELLRRADFVSVHCPRSSETFGMIGRDELALMKPTAYFISTARGGIHQEDALVEALAQKRIAGAGVDVFLAEPPAPDHPLLAFDNVIATPHIAGMTEEAKQEMAASAARQWIAIFNGAAPRCLVNPDAWQRYVERFERLLGFRPAESRAA